MLDKHSVDFSQPIPLFSLPRCVLLPHASIPLHIFESRYRRMTREALDGHGLIAMATFAGKQWRQNYRGSPPVREHVCVGYIIRHDRLPDGRYNILLQGLCRASIVGEVDSTPYRKAMLCPTEKSSPMEIDLSDMRARLEELLGDKLLKGLACVSAIHNWLNAEIPTPALVDLATMTVCCDTDQRYKMLAEPNLLRRSKWLENHLRDTRETLIVAERFRPAELADHVYLN